MEGFDKISLRKCYWRRNLTKKEEASYAPVLGRRTFQLEKTASSKALRCARCVGGAERSELDQTEPVEQEGDEGKGACRAGWALGRA